MPLRRSYIEKEASDSPKVLYEDNHLLIVNKPAGMILHADDQISLLEYFKDFLKEKYNKPGNVFLNPAHQIDQLVSGAVVLCKTSKSLSRMTKLFREREIEKIYWALTDRLPPAAEDHLEHYIEKNAKKNYSNVYSQKRGSSKIAQLDYKIIKVTERNFYLLEVKLGTGRHHQIRAQLAKIGCPIIGDRIYGSQVLVRDRSVALHSRRMSFIHPVTKEEINIEAPLPRSLLWREAR